MWVDFLSFSGAMVTYRAAANHRRGERGKERRERHKRGTSGKG